MAQKLVFDAMDKVSQILAALMGVALVILISPGILAMNRGRILRNIALWVAIFLGLALVYQNFGPGKHGLNPPFFAESPALPSDQGEADNDAPDDSSQAPADADQGFQPPKE